MRTIFEQPSGDLPDEDLWTVERAARFLGVSKSWVYRAAEAGTLPHRKVASRVRFVPKELRRWVDSQGKAA